MKFYLTTAIPYVNAAPHVGHALEFVQGDAIARYHRLLGDETAFLSGADENALKIVQAAQNAKKTPKQLTDENTQKFIDLAKTLNINFDYFQRGSEDKHYIASQKLWQLCFQNGDIYKKTYEGLYCVGCEAFYTEKELDKKGCCPEHLKKPEKVREENYFFRLSKYQNFLLDLIESEKLKIIPQFRKNEVISFIKQGLADFSISRSKTRAKGWGVPVPDDPNQIIYVWFDALNIYQSGIGFGWDEKTYQKWWPADVHLIGKGITRFHAVYWPAILKSAGLKLPKTIVVHGYVTVEGQKMSKSIGNVIDPFQLVKKYGSDAIRYYLLREIPTFDDGDYSENRFKEVYNADLANGLGNLIARIAKLSEKINFIYVNNVSFTVFVKQNKTYQNLLENYRLSEVLGIIWKEITTVNQYIDEHKPWTLTGADLENVLKHCSQKIIGISWLLKPFLPETAQTVQKQFSNLVKSAKPLFPRII